jgi:molecular chaperone DnaK (HSP70)
MHRHLLVLAGRMIGFKSVAVLEGPTAVATLYGVDRIKKGARKAQTILFVDVGGRNVGAFVWKFRPLGDRL